MTEATILLVSYHFYPSPEVGAKRPSQTAKYLQARGFRMVVCRGIAKSLDRSEPPSEFGAIELISVSFPRKRLTNLWKRVRIAFASRGRSRSRRQPSVPSEKVARQAPQSSGGIGWLRRQFRALESFLQGDKLWLLSALSKTLWRLRGRNVDLVIASGPPIAGYICGTLVARFLKSRLLLDFRDPWYLHGDPERKTQIVGHPLANLENHIGQLCVSSSDAIVVSSPGIEDHLRDAFSIDKQAIWLVRNGFEDEDVVHEPVPTGRLTMLYAGSLYWNRNPFPFLEALRSVCESSSVSRSNIQFQLVGRCADWNGISLQEWIDERGLQDVVTIAPPVDRDKLRALVVNSNVLVNFAQGQARQIPAKSYEYIASGREILTLAERDSAVACLFAEACRGVVVEPEDAVGLREAIMELYERFVSHAVAHQRTTAIDGFSRIRQLERFEAAIEECLGADMELHGSA